MKKLVKGGIMILLGMMIFGLQPVQAQVHQVPELVDVQEASKRLKTELMQLGEELNEILKKGGAVPAELQARFDLFHAVEEILEINATGTTTFHALAGNCNLSQAKADDQAYQDFLEGRWDVHMEALIKLLAK